VRGGGLSGSIARWGIIRHDEDSRDLSKYLGHGGLTTELELAVHAPFGEFATGLAALMERVTRNTWVGYRLGPGENERVAKA